MMITLCSGNVLCFFSLLCYFVEINTIPVATTVPPKVESILKKLNPDDVKHYLNGSRRIIIGSEAKDNRPYMVYLKLPTNSPKYKDYRSWLCSGVIIHFEFILTSAACIEDVKHFYIVSGTYLYNAAGDRYNNMCIKNGARKAIWKCVPKNYVFDGHENDNIRWMNNDIAVVQVEEEFDFHRRIRGCDFIPQPICYNNQSAKLEEPGSIHSIAGWGSTAKYNEQVQKQELLEAQVVIINKKLCKRRWGKRYHNIIDNYMICTRDVQPDLSEICSEKYVDCTDVHYDSIEDRRFFAPQNMTVHSANHKYNELRRQIYASGGFCENDHGGPLVAGSGPDSMVIGIISACLVKEGTLKCYGPFLYTSVWKNRYLIECAIFKGFSTGCDKFFRADGNITHVEEVLSWKDHPDGPAKNELIRTEAEINEYKKYKESLYDDVKIEKENNIENVQKRRGFDNTTEGTISKDGPLTTTDSDKFDLHSGIVLRSFMETAPPTNTPSKNLN